MNQFKSFHRISIVTPEGVTAIGQNVPEVLRDGKLYQGSAYEMLRKVTCDLGHDIVITDIKMEEFPLEGDYRLRCVTDYLTDEGLAFALASILNWKSPLNGAEIFYKAGEGIYANNPVDIFTLGEAFKSFDPVNDLALCMSIMQRFKVPMRYDDRTGAAVIRPRPDLAATIDDTEIRREICRYAIEDRHAHIPDSGWDGTVHLSMLKLPSPPPMTIAEMAPGQQESISILKDPPKPSDVFSAAALESNIRVGDASRFTGEQKD